MKNIKNYQYHIGLQGGLKPNHKQFAMIKFFGGSRRFVKNRLKAINDELFNLT